MIHYIITSTIVLWALNTPVIGVHHQSLFPFFLYFGGRRSEWSLWSFAWTIGQWGQEWRATMKGCVLPLVFAGSSFRLLWNLTWLKSSEKKFLTNNSFKVIGEYKDAYGGAVGTHLQKSWKWKCSFIVASFDVSVWKQVQPLVALNNVVSSGARRAAHSKQIEEADGFNFRDLSSP